MITPFDLKARVDLDAVSALVEFYLAAGAKGLFANCLSSEMFSITEDERLALTRHVVKQVNGRVPVVATGSFGLTIEDKAEFVKRIFDTGVHAVILVTGHFAKEEEGDDVLLRHVETLFRLTTNIPLGTYECPAPYKRILRSGVFQQLVSSGRLVYHKDTSISHEQVKAKLDVLAALPDHRLEFYDAHTPNAMFSLREGATGLSSISGNFYPEILVWMVAHATDPGKQQEASWLQQELSLVDPMIHINYPVSAKYFLQKRGLPVRPISRAVAMKMTPDQRHRLDALFVRFQDWCGRLGINVIGI